MVNMILQYIQNNLGVVIRLILLPRLSLYLFPKYKRLVYDSYLRKIGICVSGLRVVSYLCSICAFRGHNSALSQALFHLGEIRKSASHSALLFPCQMNVCSDIKNKNAKRPNFHKGESISQSFSDEWQYKDTNKFCNSNTKTTRTCTKNPCNCTVTGIFLFVLKWITSC